MLDAGTQRPHNHSPAQAICLPSIRQTRFTSVIFGRVFVRACRAPERSEACNDAHGAARSCTVCGLIANRRSVGISCATMQHVETPKDVSGIVAIPSGFESARRSASVALLGTLHPLIASLFQCLEYDDEVRVGLAHVLSQALPLFRGQVGMVASIRCSVAAISST